VNASTSYRFAKDIEIYGSIVNLFDEKYSDSATASASSSTLGMPLTLTAGLRWQF
jgi:outer membrane receptor protein involved in Fe transport